MQLKDVTPIIKAILEERDKIPLLHNMERYIPNWTPWHAGNFMRGGIRKALRVIEQAPVVDAVQVVRCKDCWKRGNEMHCPMCYDEWFYDDDDGSDFVTRDYTEDYGFCYEGAKMDGGAGK